jgi:hypothetical protein
MAYKTLMILAKPIKNLLYCLGVATVTFTACRKITLDPLAFSEGYYSGRVITTSYQAGNNGQTILPANISFTAGNYTANFIPVNQLPYTTFIPFTGIYELHAEGTILALYHIELAPPPLPAIDLLKGEFTITTYQADSLILTQTLPGGLSTIQYRLKKSR